MTTTRFETISILGSNLVRFSRGDFPTCRYLERFCLILDSLDLDADDLCVFVFSTQQRFRSPAVYIGRSFLFLVV